MPIKYNLRYFTCGCIQMMVPVAIRSLLAYYISYITYVLPSLLLTSPSSTLDLACMYIEVN